MNWQKIHKQVKWFWSWLWRKDAFIFLLFVGLAFIFWWGQAISSPRDMRMRVSVSYTDIPSSIALDRELPQTIEVTLRDEGKQLRQVRRQGLQLHINMQPYLQGEKGGTSPFDIFNGLSTIKIKMLMYYPLIVNLVKILIKLMMLF